MIRYITSIILMTLFVSCGQIAKEKGDTIHIVTTTTIITDLVENIGGDKVEVTGLMGPGIDPHLYKASEGDVSKLYGADLIIYSGLHLEGKLVDVFAQMERQGKQQVALGEALDKDKLRVSDKFGGNYDPHVWFDVGFFKEMAKEAERALTEYSPENADYFKENLSSYLIELDALEKELHKIVETLPKDKRRLVTAHDAFSYFGRAFDFDVVGLQGLSTATEAGVKDVREIRDYILDHNVRSIYIESSVPRRTIEALQQAVLAKNHEVEIGGMLYSDALGDAGTEEGTYIGMFLYNVNTLVEGLK